MLRRLLLPLGCVAALLASASPACARGSVGERIVMHTVTVDDGPVPLAVDVYAPDRPLRGTRRPPAAIVVHGGSWVSGSRGSAATLDAVRELTGRGFDVFAVDYRMGCGTGDYSDLGSPSPWLCGYGVEDSVQDVTTVTRYVVRNAARFGFDRTRVSLVGLSAGGHLALLAALRSPYRMRVQHVVSLSGPPSTRYVAQLTATSGRFGTRQALSHAVGCPTDDGEAACVAEWERVDPAATIAPGATYPFDVTLVGGTEEPQARLGWAEWRTAAATARIPTTYVGVPGTCHAQACLARPVSPRKPRTTVSLIAASLSR